ncbi:MAG: GlmU family protein [Chitinophagales bacterium]|nr:GlmU family protein [Chitinophagales bacterium]
MTASNIVLFDSKERYSLLPFTYTRSVADIRIGILKIIEKWNIYLQSDCSVLTLPYLQNKYTLKSESSSIYINASILPDNDISNEISNLPLGTILKGKDEQIIAAHLENPVEDLEQLNNYFSTNIYQFYPHSYFALHHPWDIFTYNDDQIRKDIKVLQLEPNGHLLESDNKISNPENIYVEEGAKAYWSMLNAKSGPIYLGKDSEVMEGSIIKGSFALGEHSVVKMGAKIYGETSIGPYSKVGGEIGNSVIFGYSNKGHDGYLGNSVLGEWCNLGADTNNSNLKNNYSTVRAWSYNSQKEISTGLQFCGLMMGDHSKCGINTMFNTGTVVGVSANIYGGNFPPKFIPSFSWGGSDGLVDYDLDKALETAQKVMERRQIQLNDIDKAILAEVYKESAIFRQGK